MKFLARSAGYTLFLSPLDVVITFQHSAVTIPTSDGGDALVMTLVGGNSGSQAVGQHELPGRSSYFAGPNPQSWHTGIPTFEYVQFTDVYRGIDVRYRGPEGLLECEFSLSPKAEASQIAVEIGRASDLSIQRDGRLVVRTADRELQFHPATAYQEAGSGRQPIRARYRLLGSHRIGFEVDTYDRTKPLFIGPVLRIQDSRIGLKD